VPDDPQYPLVAEVVRKRIREYTGAAPTIIMTPGLSPEFGRPDIPDDPGGGSGRARDTGTRDTRNPREGKRGARRGGRNPEVKRAPPPVRDLLDKKLPQVLPQPPPNLRPPSPIDLTLPYTELEGVTSTASRIGAVGRGLLGLAGAGLNFLGLFLTPSPLGDSDLGLSTRAPPDSGDSPVGETPEVIVEAPRLPAPEPPPLPFDFLPFGPGEIPGTGVRFPFPDIAEPVDAPVAVPVPGTPTAPLTPTLPTPISPPVPVPVPVPVPLPLPATPPLPQVPTPVNIPVPTPQLPTPTPQLPPRFFTDPLTQPPNLLQPLSQPLTPPKPPGVSLPPRLAFGDVPPSSGGRGGCKPCKPCKKSKKKKKKKKKRKERTVCYTGTYTETTKSTLKKRKEQIPCQSSLKKSPSPQTRPLITSSAVPRLNSRVGRSLLPSVSRSRLLASLPRLPAVPMSSSRNRRRP